MALEGLHALLGFRQKFGPSVELCEVRAPRKA
jgi:hypothetical protein